MNIGTQWAIGNHRDSTLMVFDNWYSWKGGKAALAGGEGKRGDLREFIAKGLAAKYYIGENIPIKERWLLYRRANV